MSVRAMTWALDKAPTYLTTAERFVLVALADHVGDETGEAWPSVARLAERTGLSRRSVQRALGVLHAARIITRQGQAAPSRRPDRTPNLYRWHPDRALRVRPGGVDQLRIDGTDDRVDDDLQPVENPPSTGRQDDAPSALRGVTDDSHGASQCHPNLELEPSLPTAQVVTDLTATRARRCAVDDDTARAITARGSVRARQALAEAFDRKADELAAEATR